MFADSWCPAPAATQWVRVGIDQGQIYFAGIADPLPEPDIVIGGE